MAAGALIAGAAAAAHREAIKTADAAWAPYANARKLRHRPGNPDADDPIDPRVDGDLDGVSIAFKLGSFSGDWGVTAVSVPLAPLKLNVAVSHEGLLEKIGKIFGAKDLHLEDAAFDPKYLVRVSDDAEGKRLLDASTRAEMLALGVSTLTYQDGSIDEQSPIVMVGIPRVLTTFDELDRMAKLLGSLARRKPAAK